MRLRSELPGNAGVGLFINPPPIQPTAPFIDYPLVNSQKFCLTTSARGTRMRGIVCEAGFADASHAGPVHSRVPAGKMSYKGDILCLQ